MSRILFVFAICSILVACSPSDDAGADVDQAASAADQVTADETDVEDRGRQRQVAGGRSSEEAEALAERRDQLREQAQADEPAIRRRGTESWWRDPGVHEGLGLSVQQQLGLEDAANTALRERERLHREMLTVRRELAEALNEGNEVLANDARFRRDELQRQMEDANHEWQDAMRLLLDDDQLELLEKHQPNWGRWGGRG